jgi:RHS repeat-associated protein
MQPATRPSRSGGSLPYGRTRGTVPAWPTGKGFVGGCIDGTDLIHIGAREYDPNLGRFASVDPDEPESWTSYGYGNSNPTTQSDPTGQDIDDRGPLAGGPRPGPVLPPPTVSNPDLQNIPNEIYAKPGAYVQNVQNVPGAINNGKVSTAVAIALETGEMVNNHYHIKDAADQMGRLVDLLEARDCCPAW